jgi:hypothetical protein
VRAPSCAVPAAPVRLASPGCPQGRGRPGSLSGPGEAWIERTAKQSPTQEEAPHRSTEKARRRGEHRTQETGSGEGGRTCNECKGEARALNTTSVKIGRQKEESFNKVNIVNVVCLCCSLSLFVFFFTFEIRIDLKLNLKKRILLFKKKKKKLRKKKNVFKDK